MEKFFKYFSLIAVTLLLSVSLSACGDDDDESNNEPEVPMTLNEKLVGRWVEINLEPDESPFYLTFNSNQTGSLSFTVSNESRVSLTSTQYFKWDAGTNANGDSYITILTTGGDAILDDAKYTCSLIGNDLSFGGLRFVRQ